MIYFLQAADGGPLTIGFIDDDDDDDDLPARRKALEARCGLAVRVLATMAGGRAELAELHARFSDLRIGQTEQFRIGGDILAFVLGLR